MIPINKRPGFSFFKGNMGESTIWIRGVSRKRLTLANPSCFKSSVYKALFAVAFTCTFWEFVFPTCFKGLTFMINQIKLLKNYIFNLLFSTRSLLWVLDLIRKLSIGVMFIWEFTIYHEHYIAYLILPLILFMCSFTGFVLKQIAKN